MNLFDPFGLQALGRKLETKIRKALEASEAEAQAYDELDRNLDELRDGIRGARDARPRLRQ